MRFFCGFISPSRSQKMGAWADALLMFRLPGFYFTPRTQGLQLKVALNPKTNRQVSHYHGCLLRIKWYSLCDVYREHAFAKKNENS